jgi:hypothetical protein
VDAATRREYDERLAEDLAQRLRRACAHLSPAAFNALVADLVAMKARFRAIDRNPAFWCHVRNHPAATGTEYREWPGVRAHGRRDD